MHRHSSERGASFSISGRYRFTIPDRKRDAIVQQRACSSSGPQEILEALGVAALPTNATASLGGARRLLEPRDGGYQLPVDASASMLTPVHYRNRRKGHTGRRLMVVVLNGSGASFAGHGQTEQRVSSAMVDGRLLLRLAKEH